MNIEKNTSGQKVSLYFARYAYKTHNIVKDKIIWDGLLKDCPKNLLDGVKLTPKHKYVRVWTT